jgi:hypothetical protein
MATIAKVLSWQIELGDYDPQASLENEEERARGFELFKSALYSVFGEDILERHSEVAFQIDQQMQQGIPLTKERMFKWISMISDETVEQAAWSVDAFRTLHRLAPMARLILGEQQNEFIEGNHVSSNFVEENRIAVRFFKECLIKIYGKWRVENCAKVMSDLERLEQRGNALTKLKVMHVMMELSDIRMDHVQRGFQNVKVIHALEGYKLNDELHKAILDLTLDDDVMISRLHTLDEILTSLEEVQTFDELSQAQFQEIVSFFNPVKNFHNVISGHSTSMIESLSSIIWSKVFYEWDWGHWMGKKNMMTYHRLKVQQEVDELPGDTLEEKWEGYRELLSKEIVYQELKKGMLIPAPNDTQGLQQQYQVMKEFVSGQGMVAYLLVRAIPSMRELPPILLFRGTTFSWSGLDAISNFIADLEPHLGKIAYDAGKEDIFASFEVEGILDAHDDYLEVMGHSFGGVMAQRMVDTIVSRKVKDRLQSSCLSQIQHIHMTMFNSPALEEERTLKFAERIDQIDDLQVRGKLYKTLRDHFHTAGVKYLGSGCDRQKVPFEVVICSGNRIDPHLGRFFNKAAETIEERNVERLSSAEEVEALLSNLENPCIETTRQILGYIGYILLRILRFFLHLCFDWRARSISAQEEEVVRMTTEVYLDEVRALAEFLIICTSIDDGKRERLCEWTSHQLDYYLTVNCDNSEKQRSMLEQMQQMLPVELLDQLLFALLTPMTDRTATDSFKRKVQFESFEPLAIEVLQNVLQERLSQLDEHSEISVSRENQGGLRPSSDMPQRPVLPLIKH